MRRRQPHAFQTGDTLPQTMEQVERMERARTRRKRKKKYRCFGIRRSCEKREGSVQLPGIALSFVIVIVFCTRLAWKQRPSRRASEEFPGRWAPYVAPQFPRGWTPRVEDISNVVDLVLPSTLVSRRLALYPSELNSGDKEEQDSEEFGGLHLKFLGSDDGTRVIYNDFKLEEGEVLTGKLDDDVDGYYAFDDDVKRNPYVAWEDDKIQDEKHCRRTSWYRDIYLNCNSFHEFGLLETFRQAQTKHLGEGSFRQAYRSNLGSESIIFKISVWDSEGGGEETFNYEDFDNMHKDMLIAERFTSNPYFVDIYGFCGLSMFSELMPYGDLEEYSDPTYERGVDLSFLNETADVKPLNDFEPSDKLIISLQMAEAVAFLHNHKAGVIVHDDIQLPQFLMTSDGGDKKFDSSELIVRLNDFNRAEVMLFDEENEEYCRYLNGRGHGTWRSPEEYYDKPLNEKIDIWSLGNNMYSLLTGLDPLYDLEHTKDVIDAIKDGKKSFIDPRYRTRSYAEGKIAEAIDLCWEYEPDKRADIGTLVKLLREAVQENDRQSKHAAS